MRKRETTQRAASRLTSAAGAIVALLLAVNPPAGAGPLPAVGGPLLDDARRIHDVDAVGVARDDAEIVRDDDEGDVEPA